MTSQNNLSSQLLKLLDRVVQNKTYGSLEIFFEEGKITQITQRIINKINQKPRQEEIKKAAKKNDPAETNRVTTIV